jgi:hypothetical protein
MAKPHPEFPTAAERLSGIHPDVAREEHIIPYRQD